MGRQKKNELDAILEQLKKSYATDVDDELEDSLLEDEEMEEDAELTSVLEKIFASSFDLSNNSPEESATEPEIISDIEINQEKHYEVDKLAEASELLCEESNVKDEFIVLPDEELNEELIEKKIEESNESGSAPDNNADEEEIVDDVFKAMFHQDAVLSVDKADDEMASFDNSNDIEKTSSPLDLFTCDEIGIIDADEVVRTVPEFIELGETFEVESSAMDFSAEEDDSVDKKSENAVLIEEVSEDFSDSFMDEDLECNAEFGNSKCLCVENTEDNDLADFISDEIEAEDSDVVVKKIVLDPEKYTDDILQYTLRDMSLFKPQEDIDFSDNYSQSESDEEESDLSGNEVASSLPKTEITDNDISLLMKFGYSSEITSSVGNEYAQSVIIDKNNEFAPKRHRIIHGFTGKEFSDKSQVEGIIKKFKSDKTRLLVISTIISLFSSAMIVGDIFAVMSNNVNDFISLIFLEAMITFVTILMLGKRLYSGFLGITRFEANAYSMLSVVLVEYLLYCVAMEILYFISPLLYIITCI